VSPILAYNLTAPDSNLQKQVISTETTGEKTAYKKYKIISNARRSAKPSDLKI